MPVNKTRPCLLEYAEYIQLFSKHPVVILFCLLKFPYVFLQLFLLRIGNSINPLECLSSLITTPVRARRCKNLHITNKFCIDKVRTPAQVNKLTLLINSHSFPFYLLDQFNFEFVILKKFQGLSLSNLLTGYLVSFPDNFLHLFFNKCQLFWSKGCIHIKIVIKPSIYGWTYCWFCMGEVPQNCLCQNMGGSMPED